MESYFTKQLITYIGNKRKLLPYIDKHIKAIQQDLHKDKLITLDLFSGSGVVARLLKTYSDLVVANDLELYSKIINLCYLANKEEYYGEEIEYTKFYSKVYSTLHHAPVTNGIIASNYAPQDDKNIKFGERVFFTHSNAVLIDTVLKLLENKSILFKRFILGPLLSEVSIHANTCGVFKGFYKDKDTGIGKFGAAKEDCLSRILSSIILQAPILSNYHTKYNVFQSNASSLIKQLNDTVFDIIYLDPPYNQHPYGSNYFMLNIICNGELNEEISPISGIPKNWNRSTFNYKNTCFTELEEIIAKSSAKYIILSYNQDGFIAYDKLLLMLYKYGDVKVETIDYPTFRGGRKSKNKNTHTQEFLFILKKRSIYEP